MRVNVYRKIYKSFFFQTLTTLIGVSRVFSVMFLTLSSTSISLSRYREIPRQNRQSPQPIPNYGVVLCPKRKFAETAFTGLPKS